MTSVAKRKEVSPQLKMTFVCFIFQTSCQTAKLQVEWLFVSLFICLAAKDQLVKW